MTVARRLRQAATALPLGLCLLFPLACREASATGGLSVSDLALALRGLRLVEPRFSGGFDYAPCIPFQQRGRLLPSAQCSPYPEEGSRRAKALGDLANRLQAEIETDADPTAAHAAAVFSALFGATRPTQEGRERFLRRAIRGLEMLRDEHPRNAALLNDLAVTYFLRAVATDEPASLVQSLDLIEQAAELAPDRPEVRFNRALFRDRWFLVFAARDAWLEVVEKDSEAGWREEARRRLALLDWSSLAERWKAEVPALERAALQGDEKRVRELVSGDRQRAREYAMEEKLGAWGERVLAGAPTEAAPELVIAGSVGKALASLGGDRSLAEGVAVILAATGEKKAALARGHGALGKGASSYRRWQNGASAEAVLKTAGEDLASAGSPMALWAEELRARTISHQSRYEEALALHRAVLQKARGRGLIALEAYVHWGTAWSLNRWRGSAFALEEEELSYRLAKSAGEIENAAAVRSMLGDAYYRLGQGESAIRYWYEALRALASNPLSLRRHNTLLRLPDQAYDSGSPWAAMALRREQVRSAGDDKVQQAEALYHLGTLLASNGRFREGLVETQRAMAAGTEVPQDGTGKKLVADIQANLGVILRRLDPRRALDPLSRADEYFANDGGARPDEVANLTERALTFADLQRFPEARKDLARAFHLLEVRGRSIASVDLRSSFEEASQRYYDAAIDIEWRQNRDPGQALALLERARGGTDPSPLPEAALLALREGDLGALARLLPAEVPVVEYAVLPQSLLIWTFHRGVCRFESRPIPETKLAEQVHGYVGRVASGASQRALRASAEKLGALLIPESLWSAPPTTPVLLIPDKSLRRLPFASLRRPKAGTFLVEVVPLALAPSLSSLLAEEEADEGFSFDSPALLVGNPALDRSLVPSFGALPGAEREIRQIAPRFRQAEILLGAAATKGAFLSSLEQVETLVFSGHSVANLDRPGASYLVLAPSKSEAGAGSSLLFADEVLRLRLPHLRTVILSSCTSVGPRDGRIAGINGLARPFFAAGASTVLGTLWNVGDETQARLLDRLFLRLQEGRTLPQALRSAQVAALRSRLGADAAPKSWSGLERMEKLPPR